MVSTTARYIYTVYRLKSVSLAAEELFISQPALSRAIKKAETELGAPLFNRKTLPFSLTAEGKLYIAAVEKMLQLEKETGERVNDIHHMQGGTLRIGTASHLCFYVIPKVLKEFQKQHPHIDIHIVMTNTDKLYEQLEKKTADLIFVSGGTVPDNCFSVDLLPERFVVAMPCNMVPAPLQPYAINHESLVSRTYDSINTITDMSFFDGIEFIYNPPNTNIHKKRKILLGKSDISPYVTSNVSRQQLNYNLMRSGFGALLTTDANIATMLPDPACAYFVLGDPAAKQNLSVIYPKREDSYLNRIANEFMDTAKSLFSCENPLNQLTLC